MIRWRSTDNPTSTACRLIMTTTGREHLQHYWQTTKESIKLEASLCIIWFIAIDGPDCGGLPQHSDPLNHKICMVMLLALDRQSRAVRSSPAFVGTRSKELEQLNEIRAARILRTGGSWRHMIWSSDRGDSWAYSVEILVFASPTGPSPTGYGLTSFEFSFIKLGYIL